MSDPNAPMTAADVIYDWNRMGDTISPPLRRVEFVDETLRDGIQCPSVTDPDIESKKEIVRLLDAVGVNHCDLGLPGAGPRAVEDVKTLARVSQTFTCRDPDIIKLHVTQDMGGDQLGCLRDTDTLCIGRD